MKSGKFLKFDDSVLLTDAPNSVIDILWDSDKSTFQSSLLDYGYFCEDITQLFVLYLN